MNLRCKLRNQAQLYMIIHGATHVNLKENFSKIYEKDNSPRDDYCFSFSTDIPQGLTPHIIEEINGRESGRIHIPRDGDYTDGKQFSKFRTDRLLGKW